VTTATPVSAIRVADWKLIEYFEESRTELFNLKTDPSEQMDLAATEPAQAAILRQQLDRWRREVGAQLPQPNPVFKKKANKK